MIGLSTRAYKLQRVGGTFNLGSSQFYSALGDQKLQLFLFMGLSPFNYHRHMLRLHNVSNGDISD
jgi:hypothetical protein